MTAKEFIKLKGLEDDQIVETDYYTADREYKQYILEELLEEYAGVKLNTNTVSLNDNGTIIDATTWSGGWVTDNFATYYLDKNMVRHYDKKTK